MYSEESNRKINGASIQNHSLNNENENCIENIESFQYESCPEKYKKLLENINLDELVYWKLKEDFDRKNIHNENEILKNILADVERPLFALILNKSNGNQSKAAALLGCNRNTLHRKLKEFLINPKDVKKTIKNKSRKNISLSEQGSEILLNNSQNVESIEF